MDNRIRLRVVFFKTNSGTEPVRDWIKLLGETDRKIIGEDIKTAQFGWPLGMPLIRKMDTDLWEVRSRLSNRVVRVLFTVQNETMILLHGFIRLLSQLTFKLKIADSCNEIKPESKTFSSVSVSVLDDPESLDSTNHMFVKYSLTT